MAGVFDDVPIRPSERIALGPVERHVIGGNTRWIRPGSRLDGRMREEQEHERPARATGLGDGRAVRAVNEVEVPHRNPRSARRAILKNVLQRPGAPF